MAIRPAGSTCGSAPHVASRTFSGSAGQVWHRMIEKFEQVGTNTVTSAFQMFYGCSSLQSVTLDTGAVVDAFHMFTAVHRSNRSRWTPAQ